MKAQKRNHLLVYSCLLMLLFAGCASVPSMQLRSTEAPDAVYCNDMTGHFPGAKPWILGGTCCCTPTEEMFQIYQSEGTIPAGMDYRAFLQEFSKKDIVTDLTPGYKGSNNYDDHGPHVVLGGHSMVTPVPGTYNYECVVAGKILPPVGPPEK